MDALLAHVKQIVMILTEGIPAGECKDDKAKVYIKSGYHQKAGDRIRNKEGNVR